MADGAGWYADPGGRLDTFRWWDGRAWTRWLSADPAAADPGPPPPPAPPEPPPPAPAPDDNPAGYAPPAPGDRAVRLPTAAAVIVAGVVLAVIAVGAVISLTADRPSTGPAVAPPPPIEAPLVVTYNATSRAAAVEELRVVLPADPFTCESQPREVPGVFFSAVVCRAPVHQDYDAKSNDWGAVAGIGLLNEDQTQTDLRELLASTASDLIRQNYRVDDVTIEKAKNRAFPDVAPDGRARIVTAELHVSHPGLPTTYDVVQVALFRLESGRYAAWWGFAPNDSPPALTRAVRRSADSITARK